MSKRTIKKLDAYADPAAIKQNVFWLPADTTAPEEFTHVFIYINGEYIDKGFFDGDEWHSYTFDEYYTSLHIEYWAYFPDDPY